jgi:hypothetical protein
MTGHRKKVTATQLARLIERQLGHSATIVVNAHETLGFVARGMTADGKVIATQQLIEAIVATLRSRYELGE